METALEIIGVTKRYAGFELKDISFSVSSGSIVGLIGQNGAGKSTLIRSVLGLIKRDGGSIFLPCVLPEGPGDDIRHHVGYVPETLTFYEWMTVKRLIRFVSSYYNAWDDNYCQELLSRYELDGNKLVKHLSRGMRAKLALLLALSHRPPILILDEPTSGLDPKMKYHFLQELRHVLTTGRTRAILVSSHILSEVEQIADYLAILRAGELSLYEKTSALLTGWKKITFSLPHSDFAAPFGAVHTLGNGQHMILTRDEEAPILESLRKQGALNICQTSPDFQEIFLAVA